MSDLGFGVDPTRPGVRLLDFLAGHGLIRPVVFILWVAAMTCYLAPWLICIADLVKAIAGGYRLPLRLILAFFLMPVSAVFVSPLLALILGVFYLMADRPSMGIDDRPWRIHRPRILAHRAAAPGSSPSPR